MKRFFILLVLTSFCLVGCSWFGKQADVEIVGIGLVYDDNGVLVANIDSTRYTPSYVYVTTLDGKARIYPDQTLTVTAFKLNGNPDVEFIAGILDEESLKEYFSENNTGISVFLSAYGILMVIFLWYLFKRKKQTLKIKKKE